MAAAIQLDPSRDETGGESYLTGRVTRKSGTGGDAMDDVFQRLGAVESSISALRADVSGITATMPYLATKEDLKEVKGQVSGIIATIPHLATKEDLKEVKGQVSGVIATIPHLATKADLNAMEGKIIKWIIATVIATAGVAFSIAKFVH